MTPTFSLSALTALELPPPALMEVAAATGCSYVGLRLIPVVPGGAAYPLMDDPELLRRTLTQSRDSGVGVADLEIVMLRPETDVTAFRPFLDVGAALGARHVLVAGYDDDRERLVDNYAAFCREAAAFGLTGDLEFMPWTAVPDLATAIDIVGRAAQPNAGILIDALHFDRSDSRLPDIADVPREWLHYWQLCDAPAARPSSTAELLHTARAERMIPGEGGLDLKALARAMPDDLVVSLEIPMLDLARTVPARDRVSRAVDAARKLLAKAPARGH
ncbi:sugar phosphate isomerase/epimerase family protein [Roseomonas populi]|uniref:Sugar phosphate isomerase/epimerase n=1 Tax=Roseomonas populi TaxID=3121582 RepID=A0ABT1X9R0_9PROT|nr:sugar phosphate isomerase/epimerase [Roseomonas pecuniae]MCR0983867.1 sugar phosphate isomerase/epimerase [Roseomonas pecuniae]